MLSSKLFNRSLLRLVSKKSNVRLINYDGETYSKSSLNLLTKEDDGHTYVEAFSPIGFRLTNGLRILGPCALFPKSVLHWNVASSERITPDSLSLFSMLEPKPDILIIGVGERGASYDKNIIKFLRSQRINVEVLPTEQACTTFNFLNSERRVVAAALIPPAAVDSTDDDFIIEPEMEGMDSTISKGKQGKQMLEDNFTDRVEKNMEKMQDKGLTQFISENDRARLERDEKRKEEEYGKDVDDNRNRKS